MPEGNERAIGIQHTARLDSYFLDNSHFLSLLFFGLPVSALLSASLPFVRLLFARGILILATNVVGEKVLGHYSIGEYCLSLIE